MCIDILPVNDAIEQWWATFFTTAGRKNVGIFVAGRTHNTSHGAHNIHSYYFFSYGAWRAAQELLVSHVRPAGRRLPTPAIEQRRQGEINVK